MTWQAYIDAAHRGINGLEADLEADWRERDAWLSGEEERLRAALVAALLLWPFDDRGRLDRARRAEIRAIRRRAIAAIDRFEERALRRFTGGRRLLVGERPLERSRYDSLRRASHAMRQMHVWRSRESAFSALRPMIRAQSSAEEESAPSPSPRPRPAPAADIFEILERGRARVISGPYEELLNGASSNPAGTILTAARQFRERVNDLAASRARAGDIVRAVNGSSFRSGTRVAERRPSGLRVHRGHLRLAVQTHARAAFRAEWIRDAEERGIGHFLLEVPAGRKGAILPGGLLSSQVHQVRSLEAWRNVIDAINQTRRAASSFEFGGLHHGDFSVPVPIPAVFLEEARAYSQRARARLLRELRRAA